MARARPIIYGGHPFALGGGIVQASNGRQIPKCADCGKAANAPAHRATAIPGPAPDHRRREAVAAVRAVRLAERREATERHRARLEAAPPPRPLPRRLVYLALILDDALEADAIPVRAVVQATALRMALEACGVPRTAGQADPDPDPGPNLEPERLAVGEVLAPWITEPVGKTHHAAVDPALARARSATKGIRSDRFRALATRAIAAGWAPRRTGDGHLRLELTGHRPIIVSTTATDDAHSWGNAKAAARRAGLDVAGL